MSQRLRQILHNDERGIAMAVVVLSLLIVSIIVGVMFQTVLAEQTGTRTQRNVTNARQAAEAGVDEIIYKLNQSGEYAAAGAPGGKNYPTNSTDPAIKVGQGTYRAHVEASGNNRVITATGTFNGNQRSLKVTVSLEQKGLDYAMYSANDIVFHNHGGPLSISIATTKIYAGGDITVDYPANFRLGSMSAQGEIELSSGGGDGDKVGAGPGAGYHWSYSLPPIGARSCWPGAELGHVTGTTIDAGPSAGDCGVGAPNYSGHAAVMGDMEASSITVDTHGRTLSGPAGNTQTGQHLDATAGNLVADTANIGGTGYTANGTYGAGGSTCLNCSVANSNVGGKISGTLKIQDGFKPEVVGFPDISYDFYKAEAVKQQGNQACAATVTGAIVQHCFTGNNFATYISTVDANHNLYKTVDPTNGTLSPWPAGTTAADVKMPDVIMLEGDYFLTAGDVSLDRDTITANAISAMCNAQKARGQLVCSTPTASAAYGPYIIVRGSLIAAVGDVDLTQALMLVGPNNRVDFLERPVANTPFQVNVTKFLQQDPAATEPVSAGVLGAGGKIDARDNQQDVPNGADWTGGTYVPQNAAPAYLRGVIVNATWNGTHLVPGQEQHWHVFDPKNIMRLYGSEIGGKLHNCNNFQFTYDPIIKGVRGQPGGSGVVKVMDYQEIRNPSTPL